VHDGTGHQVASEQDRDVGIDRDLPGTNDRADLAAGLGRGSWFPGQPEATLVQFGRTSRCHRVYPVPRLTYSVPVASQILLQLALKYIGQLTDIEWRKVPRGSRSNLAATVSPVRPIGATMIW
jgi:hypothetical protein